MSLRDEVVAETPAKWTRNVVDRILGPDDAAELAEMLADPLVVVNSIHRALKNRGIGVSESAVQKWAADARNP